MKIIATAALLLSLALPASAECTSCDEPLKVEAVGGGSWHLLVKRHGTFNLTRGLTEGECEFMRARALGLPATAEEKAEAKRKADEAKAKHDKELVDFASTPVCAGKSGENVDWGNWRVYCDKGAVSSVYNQQFFTASISTWNTIDAWTIEGAECFK